MAWFKPHNLLDRTFEVGIILKGLDGAVEVVGGLLLLVVPASLINSLAVSLTRGELSEDPHDLIATHLLRTAHGLTGAGLWYGALYLLSHGILKVLIVWALLRNKLWAYPWAILFLLVFIVYQTYRVALDRSLGLAALTIFDTFVAWLTYREWQQQKSKV